MKEEESRAELETLAEALKQKEEEQTGFVKSMENVETMRKDLEEEMLNQKVSRQFPVKKEKNV